MNQWIKIGLDTHTNHEENNIWYYAEIDRRDCLSMVVKE